MTWQRLQTLAQIHSSWLDIFCERWQDDQGHLLDYWRVEKADSIIVLPLWQDQLLLPPPFFRVGAHQMTYDFPGGRALPDKTLAETATAILTREMAVPATAIQTLTALNQTGWLINSAFSNQKLYGFVAEIQADYPVIQVERALANTPTEIQSLLDELVCLQCRAVLLEWLRKQIGV